MTTEIKRPKLYLAVPEPGYRFYEYNGDCEITHEYCDDEDLYLIPYENERGESCTVPAPSADWMKLSFKKLNIPFVSRPDLCCVYDFWKLTNPTSNSTPYKLSNKVKFTIMLEKELMEAGQVKYPNTIYIRRRLRRSREDWSFDKTIDFFGDELGGLEFITMWYLSRFRNKREAKLWRAGLDEYGGFDNGAYGVRRR